MVVLELESPINLKFIGCNKGFEFDCKAFIDLDGELVFVLFMITDVEGGFGEGVFMELCTEEYGGVCGVDCACSWFS